VVRRPKYGSDIEFALRDEEDETSDGSGMAGSGVQPCQPV
jgi:hypothetical protein